MKIKITESGFEAFDGNMFGIDFENGISTRDVVNFEAARIGAAVRVVAVDVDGNELGQVGPSQVLLEMQNVESPVVTEESSSEENSTEAESVENTPEAVVSRQYTREELSMIADAEGITGLRRVTDKLDVRGRSIVELIDGVLKKQALG